MASILKRKFRPLTQKSTSLSTEVCQLCHLLSCQSQFSLCQSLKIPPGDKAINPALVSSMLSPTHVVQLPTTIAVIDFIVPAIHQRRFSVNIELDSPILLGFVTLIGPSHGDSLVEFLSVL